MTGKTDFGVDEIRAAALAIDLHRGHLDLSVATMPVRTQAQSDRIVAAAAKLFGWCRARAIPVVHLVTTYRDVAEIRANPFWRTGIDDPKSTRRNAERHNLAGSPGCTVMPALLDPRDWIVDTKKRYDCFVGTDLDFLLRSHGVNTLIVTGVNTNSCVLSTVAAACSKDYAVIVAEDCVDTMDDPALHDAALLCIRTALGFVMTSESILATLEGARGDARAARGGKTTTLA
ncbi:MAG: cysteine hydrolase [Burkholderiales bacterium]|nr:cysteine hydrolase [Burkholderiales bacterium]